MVNNESAHLSGLQKQEVCLRIRVEGSASRDGDTVLPSTVCAPPCEGSIVESSSAAKSLQIRRWGMAIFIQIDRQYSKCRLFDRNKVKYVSVCRWC